MVCHVKYILVPRRTVLRKVTSDSTVLFGFLPEVDFTPIFPEECERVCGCVRAYRSHKRALSLLPFSILLISSVLHLTPTNARTHAQASNSTTQAHRLRPDQSFVLAVGASRKGHTKDSISEQLVHASRSQQVCLRGRAPRLVSFQNLTLVLCCGVCVVWLTGSNQTLGKAEKILSGTLQQCSENNIYCYHHEFCQMELRAKRSSCL